MDLNIQNILLGVIAVALVYMIYQKYMEPKPHNAQQQQPQMKHSLNKVRIYTPSYYNRGYHYGYPYYGRSWRNRYW